MTKWKKMVVGLAEIMQSDELFISALNGEPELEHPLALMYREVWGIKGDELSEVAADSLVEQASIDRSAYDLAIRIAASRIQDGKSVPNSMAMFAAGVLRQQRVAPKISMVKGATSSKNFIRNWLILNYIIRTVNAFDILPTRGHVSSKFSACDLVAEAINQIGFSMITADTVLNVWKDKRLRKECHAVDMPIVKIGGNC